MQTDKSVNKEELPVEEKVITGAEKRAALLAARKKNLQRQKRGKLPRSLRQETSVYWESVMPYHRGKKKPMKGKKRKNGKKKKKGLTAAQKKLPKKLQQAILRRLRRGQIQKNLQRQKSA